MSLPAVFALGSCRVIKPLRFLHRDGALQFVNHDYRWYAHSAAEVIQRLDHMQGRRAIPADRLADVLDTDSCPTPPEDCPTDFALPSVGVFEISTRHGKWRDDVMLHSMLIKKHGLEGWEPRLETMPELRAHIRTLTERFDRLVLCCNIVYGADLKTPLPHRAHLNSYFRRVAERNSRITLVDPNDYIDAEDPSRDLEDQDHFRPDFVLRMKEVYREVLGAPMMPAVIPGARKAAPAPGAAAVGGATSR